jgi:hypothetical protein
MKQHLLLLVSIIGINITAVALVNTASSSGAWETGTNWSLGHAPLATEDVIVPTSFSMTVNANDVCLSLTISNGGSVSTTGAFSLSIAGNFANDGTFTASVGSTIIFNAAVNSTITGTGAFTIKNITLNMGSKTTVLDVQSVNFITGINTGAVYNFTFTQGTWKYNNASILIDCHNTGAAAALTIPFNVVIEINAGTMNLCKDGTTGNVILSGKLFINGGIALVQYNQGITAGRDLEYKVNGGTPQLYVSSGTLDCGAGFNENAATDYIDFNMTGGTIILANISYSLNCSFRLRNNVGGSTTMSGGIIIIESACNAAEPDIDMGGANIAPYSVTAGTVQFGYVATVAGATFFGIQYYTATNYPNLDFQAGVPKTVNPWASDGQTLRVISITIDPNMTLDITPALPDPNIVFLGNNGLYALNLSNAAGFNMGTGGVVFVGGVNQVINGTAVSYTFNNMTVNMTAGFTTSTAGSITSLNVANYIQTQGNWTPPANFNVTGNWTHDNGTFTPGVNTVSFTGGNAQQINGTGTSETFYNLVINKSGNTLTAGGSKGTITAQNVTQTAGGFNMTGLLAPSTLNINGNYVLTSGTFTAPPITNIMGDWTKNGGTFTPGTNRVLFTGTAAQTIGGSQASTFYNFTINNTLGSAGGVTLNVAPAATTNVTNNLACTSGKIITTLTNILTLTDETTTANIGNANSYIDGPMHYVFTSNAAGRTTLNFPIGKANDWGYAVLQVSHSNVTSYTYRAEVFNTSAQALAWTLPATVDTVSDVHYWDIDRYTTAGLVLTPSTNLRVGAADRPIITLGFEANDFVKDGAFLTICKNTTAGPTTWVDIGGSGAPAYAAGADLSGSVTCTSSPTTFVSFSRFTLGSMLGGWNPLPIELLSFNATPCEKNVCLDWATASETNNDFFTIEKTKDGNSFEEIAELDAAGNSTTVQNYSTVDNTPYEGVSYYRLKQTDFNGDFTYSDLKMVEFESAIGFAFNIYPNPNNGENINLNITADKGEEIVVVVFDATGKESFSKVIITQNSGENVFAIDPSSKLASGIYLISATSKQEVLNMKMIVR